MQRLQSCMYQPMPETHVSNPLQAEAMSQYLDKQSGPLHMPVHK